MMWPLVRDTEPPDATYNVLEPVVIVPLLSDSVPPTVSFAPSVRPLLLLTVTALKELAIEPPMACELEPLNVMVPLPAVSAFVDALLVQFPFTVHVLDVGAVIEPAEMV